MGHSSGVLCVIVQVSTLIRDDTRENWSALTHSLANAGGNSAAATKVAIAVESAGTQGRDMYQPPNATVKARTAEKDARVVKAEVGAAVQADPGLIEGTRAVSTRFHRVGKDDSAFDLNQASARDFSLGPHGSRCLALVDLNNNNINNNINNNKLSN